MTQQRETVVVVGGGYGGAAVAKALESEADVVLIDPRDAFVNAAGSPRALARPDWAHHMFFPYATMFTSARVIRGRAASVDPGGVTLESGERVDADHIVLATGSTYRYPAKPDADSAAQARADLRRTHEEVAGADRILVLGAGPVGLELSAEINEVWPHKRITVLDPAEELLPGYHPGFRADLAGQLAARGISVRLGTGLAEAPVTEPGQHKTFTAVTTGGEEITADLWFRAFGVRTNSGYLADGRLTARDGLGRVHVTERLTVAGYDHVYAVGDLTDLPEKKMAGFAIQHAEVVARNITAAIRGERPEAVYRPLGFPIILLPLGPAGGAGQLPGEDGPQAVPAEVTSEYKGRDIFTGRFTGVLGPVLEP